MQGVYQRVTEQIIASLTAGVRPWTRPWSVDHFQGQVSRPLRVNGDPYRGINVLLLWSEAASRGYSSPTWMTYQQAKELGAQVRNGERGSAIIYSSRFNRTETNQETGEARKVSSSFMRSYTVFNVDQIDSLPVRFAPEPIKPPTAAARAIHADAFVTATQATIVHGGISAFYTPVFDRIHLPHIGAFRDTLDYYSTLLHELVHWTRHQCRLNRDFGQTRFGDQAYAVEELVAELGAAFICADLKLTPAVRDDHAAYISSWLDVLGRDNRAIFTAAAHAQRAVDHLHQLQASTGVVALSAYTGSAFAGVGELS